jgi:hypothetical protein
MWLSSPGFPAKAYWPPPSLSKEVLHQKRTKLGQDKTPAGADVDFVKNPFDSFKKPASMPADNCRRHRVAR